jgi:hypothetical protein
MLEWKSFLLKYGVLSDGNNLIMTSLISLAFIHDFL